MFGFEALRESVQRILDAVGGFPQWMGAIRWGRTTMLQELVSTARLVVTVSGS